MASQDLQNCSYQESNPLDPYNNNHYLHIEGDSVGNIVRQMNGDISHPNLITQMEIQQQQFLYNLIAPPSPPWR